jgi:hypothetical protein
VPSNENKRSDVKRISRLAADLECHPGKSVRSAYKSWPGCDQPRIRQSAGSGIPNHPWRATRGDPERRAAEIISRDQHCSKTSTNRIQPIVNRNFATGRCPQQVCATAPPLGSCRETGSRERGENRGIRRRGVRCQAEEPAGAPGGQRKRPSQRLATSRSQNKSSVTCVLAASLVAGLSSHSSMHETDQWRPRKHWTPRTRQPTLNPRMIHLANRIAVSK